MLYLFCEVIFFYLFLCIKKENDINFDSSVCVYSFLWSTHGDCVWFLQVVDDFIDISLPLKQMSEAAMVPLGKYLLLIKHIRQTDRYIYLTE